jgi:hypothetical protein
MLKKILIVAVIAFVAYYVLHSPTTAGHTVKVAGAGIWHDAKGVAASLTKFVNTLVS